MTLIDREPRPATGSPASTASSATASADRPRPAPLGAAPVDRWKGAPRPTMTGAP
ncbi:hypothetical protein [Clavibacter michiganensis]|uniref:hypothetical protein n=1 Tax=Clavibacter michiganensis TaxID=28447 RepID=UPI00292D1717|nr:hypothetical protein [Clavibacter michiganensis]